jgi:hypothetical protein
VVATHVGCPGAGRGPPARRCEMRIEVGSVEFLRGGQRPNPQVQERPNDPTLAPPRV